MENAKKKVLLLLALQTAILPLMVVNVLLAMSKEEKFVLRKINVGKILNSMEYNVSVTQDIIWKMEYASQDNHALLIALELTENAHVFKVIQWFKEAAHDVKLEKCMLLQQENVFLLVESMKLLTQLQENVNVDLDMENIKAYVIFVPKTSLSMMDIVLFVH